MVQLVDLRHPDDREIQMNILATLEGSDIVWPKYGSETRGDLAVKIIENLRRDKIHVLCDGEFRELTPDYSGW